MAKVLPASCVGGVVTVNGFPIPSAEILSAGVGASEGILIIDGAGAYYVASDSSNLSDTLDEIVKVIEKVTAVFTSLGTTLLSIGAGMTGPTTAPPPTLPTDVAALNAKVVELNVIKLEVETLKGGLQ